MRLHRPRQPRILLASTPASTRNEARLATRDARVNRFEEAEPLLRAFRDLRQGTWTLSDYSEDDFPTVTTHGDDGTLEIGCIPHEEQADYQALRAAFVPHDAKSRQSTIRFRFFNSEGVEIEFIELRAHPVSTGQRRGRTVVYSMMNASQTIIDNMLSAESSRLEVEVYSSGSERYYRIFDISHFPAVHEILLDYCQRTAAEAQAAVAAAVLIAPTPTPTAPHTGPAVTWQQDWCKEQNNPSLGVEGRWDRQIGVEGTARLVIQCTSGLLVVGIGIHITRRDGAYPGNESGIAIGVEHGSEFQAYRHYRDDSRQVRGGNDEGLMIIVPDAASKDIIETMYSPRYEDDPWTRLWVLFDAGQDPRLDDHNLGADVIIPVGKRAVIHFLSGT